MRGALLLLVGLAAMLLFMISTPATDATVMEENPQVHGCLQTPLAVPGVTAKADVPSQTADDQQAILATTDEQLACCFRRGGKRPLRRWGAGLIRLGGGALKVVLPPYRC